MKDWKKILMPPTISILDAMAIIDSEGLQLGLVTDEQGKLLGTVTDGDVRRGILKGISLEGPVARIMNERPSIALKYESKESLLARMKLTGLHQIPLVNEAHEVVGLEIIDYFLKTSKFDNWVALMAGGLGTRLGP